MLAVSGHSFTIGHYGKCVKKILEPVNQFKANVKRVVFMLTYIKVTYFGGSNQQYKMATTSGHN